MTCASALYYVVSYKVFQTGDRGRHSSAVAICQAHPVQQNEKIKRGLFLVGLAAAAGLKSQQFAVTLEPPLYPQIKLCLRLQVHLRQF